MHEICLVLIGPKSTESILKFKENFSVVHVNGTLNKSLTATQQFANPCVHKQTIYEDSWGKLCMKAFSFSSFFRCVWCRLYNYAGVHRENVFCIAAMFFYIVKTSEYQEGSNGDKSS